MCSVDKLTMTQMWLLWWPKNSPSTTTTTTTRVGVCCGEEAASGAASNSTSTHSSCVSKLVRKLKKHVREFIGGASRKSASSSFQCRYDPLSYALNFDTSSCLDDEDYYQFYAFSSRFVAHPTSCRRLDHFVTL